MSRVVFADRQIGTKYKDKRVFATHRFEEKNHYFKNFDGFGLNKKILQELDYKGYKEVWVFYHTKELRVEFWKTSLKTWLEKGIEWEWEGNYGKHLHQQVTEELQLILPKKHFGVEK